MLISENVCWNAVCKNRTVLTLNEIMGVKIFYIASIVSKMPGLF